MSFLINQIDEKTYRELGFYSDRSQLIYQNEASKAQEHILSENERQILMSFSTVGQHSYRELNPNSHPPRMEMVFDATHSCRDSLNKKLLSGDFSGNTQYASFQTTRYEPVKSGSSLTQIGHFLQDFLVEESVSWLMMLALVGMIFILL
ncbi:hypothetical protein [Oscillatoria sp. CS-180]|uniref:hypothetical protein n=1 Tax=Oscillatoria sp. CS-180 TaxID=3021720 RepID=UPI00232D6805|nr:hypothetical protein [Oscillatoria sp. CS-180]